MGKYVFLITLLIFISIISIICITSKSMNHKNTFITNKVKLASKIHNFSLGQTTRNDFSTYKTKLKTGDNFYVLGYSAVDYEGDNRSLLSIKKNGHLIDGVSSFSFKVDGYGNISGLFSEQLKNTCKTDDIELYALVHNFNHGSFDRKVVISLLESNEHMKNFIKQITEIVSNDNISGVNIDIENIPYCVRNEYTQLLKELKDVLKPMNKKIIASIPAKTKDNINNNWSGGFDYKEIGVHADYVQLMTYDEHWFGGEAGPIASDQWIDQVLEYSRTKISEDKLLLGIPLYGYDWWASGCSAYPYNSIRGLLDKYEVNEVWDEYTKTCYIEYIDERDRNHKLWFENERSIANKIDKAKKYKLKGIAFWRLGFDNEEVWEIVRNVVNPAF